MNPEQEPTLENEKNIANDNGNSDVVETGRDPSISFETSEHDRPANDNIHELPELIPHSDIMRMGAEDEDISTRMQILRERTEEGEKIRDRHPGMTPYLKDTGERCKTYFLNGDDVTYIDGHPHPIEWRKKAA